MNTSASVHLQLVGALRTLCSHIFGTRLLFTSQNSRLNQFSQQTKSDVDTTNGYKLPLSSLALDSLSIDSKH